MGTCENVRGGNNDTLFALENALYQEATLSTTYQHTNNIFFVCSYQLKHYSCLKTSVKSSTMKTNFGLLHEQSLWQFVCGGFFSLIDHCALMGKRMQFAKL